MVRYWAMNLQGENWKLKVTVDFFGQPDYFGLWMNNQ
jgi:hypothetical protein